MDDIKLDKTKLKISDLQDSSETKTYWFNKTAEDRFVAIEINRQIIYGYNSATARLQRILEIIKRT